MAMTTNIIASRTLPRKLGATGGFTARSGPLLGWKIDMQPGAVVELDDTFANVVIANPGFERVATGRHVYQPVPASYVCLLKIRRVQHENRAKHALVNFAMHYHDPGPVEKHAGCLFALAIAAKIEALRFRVRKDVVIHVVQIREIHRCADLHRQKLWIEHGVLLRHDGGLRRAATGFANAVAG